jgi:hypothetical protein
LTSKQFGLQYRNCKLKKGPEKVELQKKERMLLNKKKNEIMLLDY